jgi:hypothetical protein
MTAHDHDNTGPGIPAADDALPHHELPEQPGAGQSLRTLACMRVWSNFQRSVFLYS